MSIIEKDLSRERKSSVDETNTKSESIKLLIEGNAIEERNILREAGLDFNIKKVETQVGVNLTRSKKEEQLGSKVFTIDEIKKTCIHYGLRFLQSKYYKGTIEPTLGATILDFFKSKGIDGRSHEASYNLYIMAPAKAFNLEERPDPPVIDPVMFYKISTTEGDMYALVHKWGKDFTVLRRIIGSARETSWHWFWFRIAMAFIISTVGSAAIGFNPFFPMVIICNLLIAGAAIGLWNALYVGEGSTNWENYRKSFSRDGWNSEYKFRKREW